MSIGTDVRHAAQLLRDGGLVAFATETVYGLGAHALDVNAVAKVFEVKQRPTFDPLIVHVADVADVPPLVGDFPPVASILAESCWPGPLTLVLRKSAAVPDLVTAGLPTVAVRIPRHPQAQELLRTAGIPVAAPSANSFGRISPTTAAHVAASLGEGVDYILDGGPCEVGIESTVLDVTTTPPTLLRPGGFAIEELSELFVGEVRTVAVHTKSTTAQPAPGMLSKHYAPRTPLRIVASWDEAGQVEGSVGLMAFREPVDRDLPHVEVLSSTGSLREAAANFFAALRRLDALGLDLILAERFPSHGLGVALNDRLTRAAAD